MLKLLLLFIIIFLGGCNSSNLSEEDILFIATKGQEQTSHLSPFYGQTLTIGVLKNCFVGAYQGFTGNGYINTSFYARRFEQEHPGVIVNVEIFVDNMLPGGVAVTRCSPEQIEVDTIRGQDEISRLLLAGDAPTLICARLFNHRAPMASELFIDFFPIMEADPSFNLDHFFTNVFEAAAVGGKLLTMPLGFDYYFVATNSTIPSLVAATSELNAISMADMLNLHKEFSHSIRDIYPDSDLDAFLLHRGFTLRRGITHYLDQFVNFTNNDVNFNNHEFIYILEYLSELTCPQAVNFFTELNNCPNNRMFGTSISAFADLVSNMENRYLERDMFTVVNRRNYRYFLNIPDFEEYFVNPLPLVNYRGELIIDTSVNFGLNANATLKEQALGWEFIKFVNENGHIFRCHETGWDNFRAHSTMNLNHPHMQQLLFRPHLNRTGTVVNFFNIMTRHGHRGLGGNPISTEQAFNDIYNHMEIIKNMSMSQAFTHQLIDNNLQNFYEGLLSAAQVANNLDVQLNLMLMELH